MSGNIFVLNNGEITELHETLFDNEDFFQSLIERFPNILAGEQINPDSPRKWILICREMGVPSDDESGDKWSLDHLFSDQDAVPTFVELKRSTDTRIRREVVAQMLDYAANGTEYWTMDKIRLSFEKSGGTLADIGVMPDDEDAYWRIFEENLRTGKIRLLFVADSIPMELRRIIEFLNEQMKNTEVLAVEIKQYTSDGAISTLVPRVVGQTSKAMDVKQPKGQKVKWTEKMFFEEAERISPESAAICRKMLDIINKHNPRYFYSETVAGSKFGGGILVWHNDLALFNLYVYKNAVMVEIPFQYMKSSPFATESKRKEILAKLNSIPGMNIEPERYDKRPNRDVLLLRDSAVFDAFMKVFEDLINEHSQWVT
jgi:hypothetical protein